MADVSEPNAGLPPAPAPPEPAAPPPELQPPAVSEPPQASPSTSAPSELTPAAPKMDTEQQLMETSPALTSATSTGSPPQAPPKPELPVPVISASAAVAEQSSDVSGPSVKLQQTPPASARSEQQLTVVLTAAEGAAEATQPPLVTIKSRRYPNGIVKRVVSPRSPRSRERSSTRSSLVVTPRRSARPFSPVPPQLSTRPLYQSHASGSDRGRAQGPETTGVPTQPQPVELDASPWTHSIAPRPLNYVFAPWCAVGKAVRRMYSAPVDLRRPALIAVGRALRGPLAPTAAVAMDVERPQEGSDWTDARCSTVRSAPLQGRRTAPSYASSFSQLGFSTPASEFRSAVSDLLFEEDFEVAETDYERRVDSLVQRLGRPTISSARMLPASIPGGARGVAGGGCLDAYLSPIRRRDRDASSLPSALSDDLRTSRATSASALTIARVESSQAQAPSSSLDPSVEICSAVSVSSRSASGTPFWCERARPGLAHSGRDERPYLYGGELVWARMPFIDAHRAHLWQRDGTLSRPRTAASARA